MVMVGGRDLLFPQTFAEEITTDGTLNVVMLTSLVLIELYAYGGKTIIIITLSSLKCLDSN